MRWICILAVGLLNLCFINLNVQAGDRLTREEYIELYSVLAMKEMVRTGVPASITLAQGMLESDNGNSSLAKRSNNHFGIKCHSDWTGKKVHHDDDARHECFRKYNTVYDSYVDHSDFLRNTPRYAFLFDLDAEDYEGWAKGLKKAGYATSNTYADMLIRIIKENDLHRFDLLAAEEGLPGKIGKGRHLPPVENTVSGRTILQINRANYIVVKEGDSYEGLRRELDLVKNGIFRYNEISADDVLYEGEILYLQPKRNKAARGYDYHTVKEGETMWTISQLYGIKLNKLYEKNRMAPGTEPAPGDKLYLRQKKKEALFPLKIQEDKENSEQIKIDFDDN